MRRLRNVKIVATLGPASSDYGTIRALFEAGADVFRLNMSHGTHADIEGRHKIIRQVEKDLGRPIGILADLQGPKLRVGVFAEGPHDLQEGAKFRMDLSPTPGDATRVQLPHPEIFAALEPGATLLVNDGKIALRVDYCGKDFANCTVTVSGAISNRKGVNVPDVVLPLAALSDKDRGDLEFVCDLGVDWLALSFVQRPEDVIEARQLAKGRAAILAKIEKPAAVKAVAPAKKTPVKKAAVKKTVATEATTAPAPPAAGTATPATIRRPNTAPARRGRHERDPRHPRHRRAAQRPRPQRALSGARRRPARASRSPCRRWRQLRSFPRRDVGHRR